MALTPLRSASLLADTLVNRLARDPSQVKQIKANPDLIRTYDAEATKASDEEEKRVVERSAVALDSRIYRLVVKSPGGCVIGAVIATLIITVASLWIGGDKTSIPIPDGLVALASAAVGALAGLLTPVSRA